MANIAIQSTSSYIARTTETPDKNVPPAAPGGGGSAPTTGQLWPRGK